jgi:choline kinase
MLFIKAEEDYQNGKLNLHYEECVFAGSTLQNPVYALFGRNLIWTEIDTTDDLVRARESIFPRIKSVSEKISTSREQNNGD